MIDMVDEEFEYFFKKKAFGPALDAQPVSPSKLNYYRGKLPDRLLAYWQQYGFAGYGNGLFWMTDPDAYAEVLNAWLYGTELYGRDDYYVIGRTAFGKLMVWGTRTGPSLDINCPFGTLFPGDVSQYIREEGADFVVATWVAEKSRELLDLDDEKQRPLFERACELLGPLAHDEMYGFVPALAMGGPCRLDHVKKVKDVEHMLFLAQLEEPRVMLDIVKEAKDRGLWR